MAGSSPTQVVIDSAASQNESRRLVPRLPFRGPPAGRIAWEPPLPLAQSQPNADIVFLPPRAVEDVRHAVLFRVADRDLRRSRPRPLRCRSRRVGPRPSLRTRDASAIALTGARMRLEPPLEILKGVRLSESNGNRRNDRKGRRQEHPSPRFGAPSGGRRKGRKAIVPQVSRAVRLGHPGRSPPGHNQEADCGGRSNREPRIRTNDGPPIGEGLNAINGATNIFMNLAASPRHLALDLADFRLVAGFAHGHLRDPPKQVIRAAPPTRAQPRGHLFTFQRCSSNSCPCAATQTPCQLLERGAAESSSRPQFVRLRHGSCGPS
jgi:hypothetical protein